MNFLRKIEDFVKKLQILPDNSKKIIIFGIVAVSALIMGSFTIISTKKNISKIGDSLQSINLPEIRIEEDLGANQEDFYQADQEETVNDIKDSADDLNKENKGDLELQRYKNETYNFTIDYPNSWFIDKNHYSDADFLLEKIALQEVADIHFEIVSQTQGIKTAEEGASLSAFQMSKVIKSQEKIRVGKYEGYEVIGTICTRLCLGSAEDVYSPFSIIYFSKNGVIIKIKYGEGQLGSGWKGAIENWKFYEEYKNIVSTFQ